MVCPGWSVRSRHGGTHESAGARGRLRGLNFNWSKRAGRRSGRCLPVLAVVIALLPDALLALSEFNLKLEGQGGEALADDLRDVSLLKAATDEGTTDPREIVALGQNEYLNLLEALYAKGYYSAVISVRLDGREAARIPVGDEPPAMSGAAVTVQTGPRFLFGRTVIAPVRDAGAVPETFRTGEPALASVVRSTAKSVVSDWEDAGHAKADIAAQDIVARHSEARLDAEIAVDPGPRLRFGAATVGGESRVRPSRIRKIAGLPEGQVFSPAEVARAERRLRRTGTFRSAVIEEAETPNADGTLDFNIAVTDRKPRRISFGAELSNRDGVTLSGFWLHRNILGGAETLRIDGEIAQIGTDGDDIDYRFSTRFEKPAAFGPDTLAFAQVELSYEGEPSYVEERAGLSAGLTHEFSPELEGGLGLALAYARVEDAGGKDEFLIFSMPLSLTWDQREDRINPEDGIYLELGAEPLYEIENSQFGAQLTMDARGYRRVGRSILAARLQLGALVGPEADEIPPDYLFFSGGSGTVRGQPYKSLGVDDGGVTRGGRSFVALSAELRVPVTDRIGVVGFADAGFVSPESDFGGDGAWHSGAGLGVRYATPIGPIRLDVAAPLSGDTGDGVQVYVGIGQSF